MLEGPHVVEAALDADAALEAVFVEPGAPSGLLARLTERGVPILELEAGALARVVDAATPQPIAAIAPIPVVPLAEAVAAAGRAGAPLVVVVDVQDPGNVGALLRSAEASGAAAFVAAGVSADPFGPKAVRASAGAVFHLPVAVTDDTGQVLRELAAADLDVVATDASGPVAVTDADLSGAVALLFGNEAEGLGDRLEVVDHVVAVPIAGRAESLNVAAAGAVVCFEAHRQRAGATAGSTAMDVVSTVSHELRSPLTSIQGYTSLLLDRWERFSDEQKRLLLAEMHDDAGRVARMVGELLDVSRLETGRLTLQRQRVDLASLARTAVERVALTIPELDAELAIDEQLPVVLGDPDKLQQVMLNLVENAAKYADPIGIRIVGGQPDGDHVQVCVVDQGAGIPPEDLDRIFTKFFRREHQRPSGIGLGLWISRGVMEAHGGSLTASSKMGAGTTFCLTLPVT